MWNRFAPAPAATFHWATWKISIRAKTMRCVMQVVVPAAVADKRWMAGYASLSGERWFARQVNRSIFSRWFDSPECDCFARLRD